MGALGPPVSGGCRHIPIYPFRQGLGRFALNGCKVKGVARNDASQRFGIDPVLKVTEIASRGDFIFSWPLCSGGIHGVFILSAFANLRSQDRPLPSAFVSP